MGLLRLNRMQHLAITNGSVTWLKPVTGDEYLVNSSNNLFRLDHIWHKIQKWNDKKTDQGYINIHKDQQNR